jgi:hypothetical protein
MTGLYSIMVGVSLFALGAFDESTNEPNESVQEKHAISELKKLGAKVVFKPSEADHEEDDRESDQDVWFVLIGQDWKGGDEGLKHIERLPKLSTLYIAGRSKISQERLAKLKKSMPGLAIERRTGVYLGINPATRNGCLINRIQPGSPADKAGLTQGDVIQQFDEKPIKNVNELIEALHSKEPGDEVDLTVLRDDNSIKIKVKLGNWPTAATSPD